MKYKVNIEMGVETSDFRKVETLTEYIRWKMREEFDPSQRLGWYTSVVDKRMDITAEKE